MTPTNDLATPTPGATATPDQPAPSGGPAPARSSAPWIRRAAPGLALCAVATAVAYLLAQVIPLSPLVLSLLVGAVVGSLLGSLRRAGGASGAVGQGTARARWAGSLTSRTQEGTSWTAKRVLRAGVVLLGLQLSLPEVLALGWRGLAVVGITVAVTFSATLALGRALRVPRVTSLLVATGFSICGAAAISAMQGVVGGGDDERTRRENDDAVATALALVTIFGSLAIFVLPWLAGLLGLDDDRAGLWIGASVQEVAQVVTAGGAISAAALATATVSKLARVVLLAPIVAGAGVVKARRERVARPADVGVAAGAPAARRTPPVPLFVVGFLVAVLVRSTGLLPASVVEVTTTVTTLLFTAAMFAMGLGVDAAHLVRTGRRALVLGTASAAVVTGVSLVAVLLLA
ncbi:putative sulfate exporter family transporter [Oerskovia sp. Sa1BUA8]|uniref:Sulfate exporter family transporter n=1 Tax=Oerskovia douganii TaxID=2762210 RepID=A0A9D5UAD2_9CELL|nr:putative sulfate exporter family transporter [Oerskovia douganii]MBE7700880.1 putative sulfate exporter family transporter [Oerskovia douganii]